MNNFIMAVFIFFAVCIAGLLVQTAICKGPVKDAVTESIRSDELRHYKVLTEEYKAELLHKSDAFIQREVDVYTESAINLFELVLKFLGTIIIGSGLWYISQKAYLILRIKALTADYQAHLVNGAKQKEDINSYFSEIKNSLDAREKTIKSGALENKRDSDLNIRDRNNFIQSKLDYASEANSQALSIEAGYSKIVELEKLTESEVLKCKKAIELGESVGKVDSKNGEIFIAAVKQLSEALLTLKKDE